MMAVSKAYYKGKEIKAIGKSIEYNPYRHKGTAEEFQAFIKGWNAE